MELKEAKTKFQYQALEHASFFLHGAQVHVSQIQNPYYILKASGVGIAIPVTHFDQGLFP